MRVLLAPDGFGGTLSPAQAAARAGRRLARTASGDDVDLAPLSDGPARASSTSSPPRCPTRGAWPSRSRTRWPARCAPSSCCTGRPPTSSRPRPAGSTSSRRRTATRCARRRTASGSCSPPRSTPVRAGSSSGSAAAPPTTAGGAARRSRVQRQDAAGERVPPGGAALHAVTQLTGRPTPGWRRWSWSRPRTWTARCWASTAPRRPSGRRRAPPARTSPCWTGR
jgi:hypothetical protein